MPSSTDNLRSPSGFSSSSVTAVEEELNCCLRGLDRSRALIVTSGARWTGRQPSFAGATVLQIDCRHFHDPENDRSLRGCVGRHPNIMQGVARHEAMQELIDQVKNFLRTNPKWRLVIHLYCTSGRHRSVGAATLIFHFLDVTEWRKPLLIHYHSPQWREMSCGGQCNLCGTADVRELRRLIDRFLPDVRIVSEPVRPPALAGPTTSSARTPRPMLTLARTHSTVPVPVRAPAPPPSMTTSSGTPLTPTHLPAYPPPDRETAGREAAAGRDLAVQVLANQVQELSGLVRQELEGERGRGRHRVRSSSSSRRGRSSGQGVRERRSRSRRRIPSPRTPPSVPPPRTPPRSPRREPYDESRRQQLERELFSILHENDGSPYCWNIDEDILSSIADSVRLWSNRGRTIWVCDHDLPQEVQQAMGIRIDVRIRSHVRNSMITGGKWMRQKHWIKSSFYRPRDSSGAAWDRLQRERPVGEDVGLPVSWSDLITFSHRDIGPRAYMGHLVMLSGDQGFEGQNYVPKTEAQKWSRNSLKMEAQKRNRKNPPSRFMICTDGDMFKGTPKSRPRKLKPPITAPVHPMKALLQSL